MRFQGDSLPCSRSDTACSENIQCDVHAYRAGMKQVQRPNVERAAGKIGTARRCGYHGISTRRGNDLRYRLHGYNVAPLVSSLPTAITSLTTCATSTRVVRWFTMQARRAKCP